MEYGITEIDAEKEVEIYEKRGRVTVRVRERTYHIPQKYYAVELSDGDGDHWGQVYRFATEEEAVAARDRLAYFIDKEART